MLEHAGKCGVLLGQTLERLVQLVPDLVVRLVAEPLPAGDRWHEEGVRVPAGVLRSHLSLFLATAAGEFLCDDPGALGGEDVGRPLQEERAEDVLLELGRVHLPAQDVGGGEEMAFELRQSEFGHGPPLGRWAYWAAWSLQGTRQGQPRVAVRATLPLFDPDPGSA